MHDTRSLDYGDSQAWLFGHSHHERCLFDGFVRNNLKSDRPLSRLLPLDPVVELSQADEIARRILSRKSVSDEEFRYVVMFNLTAMTQLLWELSNNQLNRSKNNPGSDLSESGSRSGLSRVKSKAIRLAPLAAIAAFLAGLGLGYILP